jgi:hypothetical protein
MVTKPTGRLPGRPKKPHGEPVNHSKQLANAPERYYLALRQALIDQGRWKGISDNRVGETMAALRYGIPFDDPSNLAAMMQGKPYKVWADPSKGDIPAHGNSGGGERRDKNVFTAVDDGHRRKTLELRKANPFNDENARWVCAMTIVWGICLLGENELRDFALSQASSVGEENYFRNTMAPILHKHASLRAAGFDSASLLPEVRAVLEDKRGN